MAIKWGPGTNTGSGILFYAGLEFSLSYPGGSLDASDTVATVTTRGYLKSNAHYANSSSGAYTLTGDETGSADPVSWSLTFLGDQELFVTATETVTLTSSPQTFEVTLGIRPSGGGLGTGWCYVTHAVTVPARPSAAPAAPTGFSVSRESDISTLASWTNNATAGAPYSNVELWRNVDGGAFSRVMNLPGSTSSTSHATSPSRRYGYRVRAVNAAGASGWSNTDYISTTPSAPTSAPELYPLSNGNLRVYRPSNVPYVVSSWRVWHAEDGVWGQAPIASLSKTTESWEHVGRDPGVTNSYRITYSSTDPVLQSSPSPSAVAPDLVSAPDRATNLSPSGVAVSMGLVPLSWDFNSTDGSAQRQYQVRFRRKDVLIWTAEPVSSSPTPALFIDEPGAYMWQVQTWGDSGVPSAWSASAGFTTEAPKLPPTATALGPSGLVRTPMVSLMWDYEQPEGSPQGQWWVEVEKDSTSEIVFEMSGADKGTRTWSTGVVLEDGEDYTWRVRVAETNGALSNWDSQAFTVQIADAPQPPRIFVEGFPPAIYRMHIDDRDHHVVSIFEKGGTRRLFDLDRVTTLRWSRKMDDTGEATVRLVPPFGSCGGRLSEIIPMRHELVIFYGGRRAWEGPITLVQDVPGQFSIKAKDVSFYLNRMVMREAHGSRTAGRRGEPTIQRLMRIIQAEGARFEDSSLPINVLPHLRAYESESDPRTTRSTEAGEKYVFDELDDLAWRGGIDYGVAGRMIYLMDTDTPVGQTRRLTSSDFTSPVEVVLYGAELSTEAYVTDRQGRWVSYGPGDSPYYGRVELLHGNYAESDDPEAAAAVPLSEMRDQAVRDFAPRYPLPMTVRVPQNATLQHSTFYELYDYLFPGVRVPLTAEGTVHNVSRMMKLKDLNVEEFEGRSSANVTLIPASEAADLIGDETE